MSEQVEAKAESEAVAIVKPSTVASFFGQQGEGILATFNPSTPEGAALLVQSTLMELPGLETVIGKDIYVSHIYSNPAQSVDDNGEVQEWRRIVLLDGKGNAYKCGSRGIGKSIGIIALCRGNPPWVPPVKCKVEMLRLKSGNSWFQLIPDPLTLIAKVQPKKADK